MKELKIGEILSKMRREKGVTQDEVAEYAGVSKASVSKWENSLSYPDITILPVLANYYHISIDELLGYQPQLEEKKIWEVYREFSRQFAERPFAEAYTQVLEFIRRYDACYPLLFAMAQLLMNNFMLAPSEEEQNQVLEKAKELCCRIRTEKSDTRSRQNAQMLEGVLLLIKKEPEQVLAILGEKIYPRMQTEQLIAGAYQMLEKNEKAMEIIQAVLYQNLVEFIDLLGIYSRLAEKPEKKKMALDRMEQLGEIFFLDHLLPHKMVACYYEKAMYGAEEKDQGTTLFYIEKYVRLILAEFQNFSIHGDVFLDRTENWLKEFGLTDILPRDRSVMKQELLHALKNNPAFSFLEGNPRYEQALSRLIRYLEKEGRNSGLRL